MDNLGRPARLPWPAKCLAPPVSEKTGEGREGEGAKEGRGTRAQVEPEEG